MAQHIAVVADDLIWASRLVAAVHQAGAVPVRMGTDRDVELAFESTTPDASAPDAPAGDDAADAGDAAAPIVGAIIDLFGHRYDGVEAVRMATAAGVPVVAIAQHDDQETRKLALDAGAVRVYSYNKFFQDGSALVARWFVADTAEAPEGA